MWRFPFRVGLVLLAPAVVLFTRAEAQTAAPIIEVDDRVRIRWHDPQNYRRTKESFGSVGALNADTLELRQGRRRAPQQLEVRLIRRIHVA